jgi:hypothetical protein
VSTVRISAINIVSWIIGSGLIVFAANSIYNDYIRQPHIDIIIEPRDLSAIVSVINTGVTTAHDVRLILYSAESDITNYRIIYSSEDTNFTKQDEPKGLVAEMNRMSPGSSIRLQTALNSTEIHGTIRYYVDVVYDEGSTYGVAHLGIYPKAFRTPIVDIFYANNAAKNISIVFAVFILSIIALIMPFVLNWVRNPISKTFDILYIHKVRLETERVNNILNREIFSREIFDTKTWDSKSEKSKQSIFRHYDDYKRLNVFYVELRRRHNGVIQIIDDHTT